MQNVLPKLGTWILDLWNSQTCIIRFELIGSSNLKNKIKGNASRQLALGNSPLLNWLVSEHPRIPRGGQSGREKRRNERFQALRQKSPWVLTLTGPFPNGQVNAGYWLGTKNALYYCAQSVNSISWVLFVSSYTTAIDSITACLHQRNARSQFDINTTFQNTVYTKTKDAFPCSLSLQQVFTLTSITRS